MPVKFWNDSGGQNTFLPIRAVPGIWAHAISPSGMVTRIVIHGRSDATLNPGGVRIGTAEIYAQVEGMKGFWKRSPSGRISTTM